MFERLLPLRARVRELPPRRVDLALATVVLVAGVVEVLIANASWGARIAALGPVAVVAAAIPLRRISPIGAVALAAVGIASTGLLVEAVQDGLASVFFGWIVVVYFLGISESGRRLAAGVAVAEAGAVVLVLTAPDREVVGELFAATAIFVAAPVFAGHMLHARLELNRALRERARRHEQDTERRSEAAALGERARIAGELHDVVAHALGAMTVQASAARRLAELDPARAGGAFEAIETTGREALGELRTLLDVLRGDEDAEPAFQPQPGLAALEELVDRFRSAGLPVALEVTGERPAALQASIDLTAYRIVQDALDAALEHGDARQARVAVRFGDGRLDVEVVDDGTRDAGRELLGLRERVRLYGGQVSAGAEKAGGHAVRATLPLERVPA